MSTNNKPAAPGLVEALAGLEVLYLREGENWNDCFERVAEVFHRETGYLRPGKDCRLHGPQVREKVWNDWIAAKIAAARAALSQPVPSAPEPSQKYDDTLLPFLALMRRELHANSRKGDRPGWLTMSREVGLLEIYWHTAKLSAAVKKQRRRSNLRALRRRGQHGNDAAGRVRGPRH